MKKLLFFIVISVLSLNLSAQLYVDGKDINQMPEVHYCKVTFNLTRGAIVDYGQQTTGFIIKTKITDNKGEVIHFHNVIHLLNYMYAHGWKYIYADTLNQPFFFEKIETNSVY